MAVVAADSGKIDQALQAIDKEYAVAEKKNDAASMAADLQAKGNILIEMLKYDAAGQQFEHSLQIIQSSILSQGVKDNATLQHHFNLAGLAIAKKDYPAAKTHAEEFRKGAETNKNELQLKQAHELAGRIALAEKNYDTAIAELQQANEQNPRNLYRLAQAYQGKGRQHESAGILRSGCWIQSVTAVELCIHSCEGSKDGGWQQRVMEWGARTRL